jgi:hypothetical protein
MNPANQPGPTICGFDIEDLDEAVIHTEPSLAALSGGSLFVTGGTGFIGQWLLTVLARANATRELGLSITVLTRSIASFAARCPQLASDPAVRCAEGDVRVFEFSKGRFTHVIYAATETSVAADRQALKLIDTIVNGTHAACSSFRSRPAVSECFWSVPVRSTDHNRQAFRRCLRTMTAS